MHNWVLGKYTGFNSPVLCNGKVPPVFDDNVQKHLIKIMAAKIISQTKWSKIWKTSQIVVKRYQAKFPSKCPRYPWMSGGARNINSCQNSPPGSLQERERERDTERRGIIGLPLKFLDFQVPRITI